MSYDHSAHVADYYRHRATQFRFHYTHAGLATQRELFASHDVYAFRCGAWDY